MVNYNTNYYRRNKEQKFKVHTCQHCAFETTGPKSSLNAHVWAKHTEEKDRPFQCPCETCTRGYSAKANLHKHLRQQHDIEIPKDNNIFAYSIQVNRIIQDNWTNEKQERIDIYNNNNVLPKKIPTLYKGSITVEQLYCDQYRGLITLQGYTKEDIIQLGTI
jgi:hypothetical protein|tara:strand:+ start:95 stop:580 length:486 start_codon:yes stop_codon:yes gene_type:complete